jgi:hypothetical protein
MKREGKTKYKTADYSEICCLSWIIKEGVASRLRMVCVMLRKEVNLLGGQPIRNMMPASEGIYDAPPRGPHSVSTIGGPARAVRSWRQRPRRSGPPVFGTKPKPTKPSPKAQSPRFLLPNRLASSSPNRTSSSCRRRPHVDPNRASARRRCRRRRSQTAPHPRRLCLVVFSIETASRLSPNPRTRLSPQSPPSWMGIGEAAPRRKREPGAAKSATSTNRAWPHLVWSSSYVPV